MACLVPSAFKAVELGQPKHWVCSGGHTDHGKSFEFINASANKAFSLKAWEHSHRGPASQLLWLLPLLLRVESNINKISSLHESWGRPRRMPIALFLRSLSCVPLERVSGHAIIMEKNL